MPVLVLRGQGMEVRPVSTVRDRLTRLREDIAAAGAEAPADRSRPGDLRARLKRMRRPSPPAGATRGAPDEGVLCERIGGRPLAEGLLVCERSIPEGFRRESPPRPGDLPSLQANEMGQWIPAFAGMTEIDSGTTSRHSRESGNPRETRGRGSFTAMEAAAPARGVEALRFFVPEAEGGPETIAFVDTETTGLAGGTGTLVFQIGLARWRGGALEVVQYLLSRVEGEAAMLDHARDWLDGVRSTVTFNGKSFDAPLLATRYRLAGRRAPFAALAHLDLLHPARRAFAGRLDDCRLGTLERNLLGLEREGDLPGHEAPRAWFDWLRRGESVSLARVLDHNRLDLLSLAALLPVLHDCYRDPVASGAKPRIVLPPAARGPGSEAAYTYLSARRRSLDPESLRALARCARRRGDWPLAVETWQALAAAECVESLESLAKFHEHVARDFGRAEAVTSTLIALEPGAARHHHRAARLRVRRGGTSRQFD